MLALGIVYKEGKIIQHRSLLKILINPFLVPFGYVLSTKIQGQKNPKILHRKIIKCEKMNFFKRLYSTWTYKLYINYDYIIRKGIWY